MDLIVATVLKPWQTPDVFHVGDVARKLREQRDWTQGELAKAAGVNVGTVSEFERDPSKAAGETAGKIAIAFGFTSSDLHALVPPDLPRHGFVLPSRVPAGGKFAVTPASARLQQRPEDVEVLAKVLAHATNIVDLVRQRMDEQARPIEGRASVRGRRRRVPDR